MSEEEINQMIRRSSGGLVNGFSDLYEQYNGLVRGVLYKLCAPAELDDLVQEAFIRIWKGLPGFRGGSAIKTWIYRIAYNLALDHFRKRIRRPVEVELKDEIGTLSLAQKEGEDSKEKTFMNRQIVEASLKELSKEHVSVLVFHCMEELSVAEVACVLDIPEGTVKSRLYHARNKMAEVLKSKGVAS